MCLNCYQNDKIYKDGLWCDTFGNLILDSGSDRFEVFRVGVIRVLKIMVLELYFKNSRKGVVET